MVCGRADSICLANCSHVQPGLSHGRLSSCADDGAKSVSRRERGCDGCAGASQQHPRVAEAGFVPTGVVAPAAGMSGLYAARCEDVDGAVQRQTGDSGEDADERTAVGERSAGAVHSSGSEDVEQLAVDMRCVLQRSCRCRVGR